MINLRILIDRDVIIVDESGSRFWAGAHGLSPAKPRYLGVRFLQTTDASPAKSESAPALTSLKIQSP